MVNINGVECLTLADLSKATGLSTEALRGRQARGTLTITPHVTIQGKHFYKAEDVRAIVREGLGT